MLYPRCSAPSCRCSTPCRAWCGGSEPADDIDPEYEAALERIDRELAGVVAERVEVDDEPLGF